MVLRHFYGAAEARRLLSSPTTAGWPKTCASTPSRTAISRVLTPAAALESLCGHSQLPTLVDSSPALLNRGESLKATAFASELDLSRTLVVYNSPRHFE